VTRRAAQATHQRTPAAAAAHLGIAGSAAAVGHVSQPVSWDPRAWLLGVTCCCWLGCEQTHRTR
jgi:hypothetical protein